MFLQKLEISRELHDNIGSQLTYINMGLEFAGRLEADNKNKKIDEIKGFAKETIGGLRTTFSGLNRDVTLNEFETKIANEVARVKNATNFQVQLTSNLQEMEIPSTLTINLYRIIQEALQNAIKHSDGSKVKIDLEYSSESQVLKASISDNGKGLLNEATNGFGLKSMNQRADKIGASLHIVSENGVLVKLEKHMADDLK